jgi:hypothetical protein
MTVTRTRLLAVLCAFALVLGLIAAAAALRAAPAGAQVAAPQTRVFACTGTTTATAVLACEFPAGTPALPAAPEIVLASVTSPNGGQSNLPDNFAVIAAGTDTNTVTTRWIGTQVVHYAGPEPGGHDGPLAYKNGAISVVFRVSANVTAYCNANPCS